MTTTQQPQTHIAVAFENEQCRRRAILVRDGGDTFAVQSTMGGTEAAAVAVALQLMAERPNANLSISERTLAEIEQEPFVENADELHGYMSDMSLTILCPEGKPNEDVRDPDNHLWTDVWRAWGCVSSSGRDGRFRARALRNVIAERFSPDRQLPAANCRREFLVRGDWRARALVPRAFLPDEPPTRKTVESEATQAQAAGGRLAESLS